MKKFKMLCVVIMMVSYGTLWDVYISATWIQNYYWVLGAAAGVIVRVRNWGISSMSYQ